MAKRSKSLFASFSTEKEVLPSATQLNLSYTHEYNVSAFKASAGHAQAACRIAGPDGVNPGASVINRVATVAQQEIITGGRGESVTIQRQGNAYRVTR